MANWFETIRGECSRAVWSRGVGRVRAQAVHAVRIDASEAVLRVTDENGLLSPTVEILLDEASWDCDCPGLDDPCEHVAAAAILLRRASKDGVALPTARPAGAGSVRYCFIREGRGLAFERRIVEGERETRVDSSLQSLASGSTEGPRVLATESDLVAERSLAKSGLLAGRSKPSASALARILPALAGCEDVRLDGEPLRISTEPLLPQGRLEDDEGGFRLSVHPDPSITEIFPGRVALCGDVLRPVRESRLSGREIEDLPLGRRYPLERALELATEILPDLAQRIPVDVRTKRLPTTGRIEPPRVQLTTKRDADTLVLRAELVYGDPPAARIEDGRLVHLQGTVPIRDQRAERRLARALQNQLELPMGRDVALRGEEALAMAERLGREDGFEEFEGRLRGTSHQEFHRVAPLVARVDLAGGGFDLSFDGESPQPSSGPAGARGVDAEAVLRAWEAGDSLVAMPGGGFAPLPQDWLERFGTLARNLLEARSDDGAVPTYALPDLARFCDAVGEPPPLELTPLRALFEGFDRIPSAPIPELRNGQLRSYQRSGVDWLCFLRDAGLGALLADDMGLGKTLQILCALKGRCLVVAPTSVLHNWSDEARKFRPDLSVSVYHGPGRKLDPTADLTLTTYALLRLDAAALGEVAWDAVVLDEAQAIKNPSSQVARAAYGLRANWRATLSGTPVENRLEELWSQLHFGNPGLLGSRARFQERYAKPIGDGAEGVAAELRTRIRPFVLRRLKRDVAPELPPRTEVVLHCQLDEQERKVYDAVSATTRRDVVEKIAGGTSVLAALEALLRLRQAACHTGLVPGQSAESSSKVSLLLDRLETAVADGHKALVFSQWTGFLDRVEPHLRAAGIPFTRLDGSTRDRGAVVEAFQGDGGPPVLLISLRAGGTGLNLTAADHVFLLDPWWNPAVEDQAADRAHRIGQTKPVIIHRLVAEGTVEERILALQARKRGLADAALGGADAGAGLTREDLLALLD